MHTKFEVNWSSQSVRIAFWTILRFWSAKYTQKGGRVIFPNFELHYYRDLIDKV